MKNIGFVYDIPVKVYFGEGQLCHLGAELAKYGKRVLLTYGGGSIKRSGLYDAVVAEIAKAGLELFELNGIAPNPRIESVREGAKICKEQQIDVLLAVGGGSVLDCTKFIGAGACYDGDPWDFFSKGAPIDRALPMISVLTLAATGSEMDGIGVISNMSTNEKLARGEAILRPKASFLDPTNTYTVSAYQTACGAADILSHVMEVYFNVREGMYMQDRFMEGLMKTVIHYAPIAMAQPDNYEARANLMWASSWGINGFIENGRDQSWSCHAMEHELSAFYDITHGLGLAILTPRWMKYCLNAETLPKYVDFGVNVFGIDRTLPAMEIADKAIEALSNFLFNTLKLDDSLTKIGIDDTHFARMAEKACRGKQINGFMTLKPADVAAIYEMCR